MGILDGGNAQGDDRQLFEFMDRAGAPAEGSGVMSSDWGNLLKVLSAGATYGSQGGAGASYWRGAEGIEQFKAAALEYLVNPETGGVYQDRSINPVWNQYAQTLGNTLDYQPLNPSGRPRLSQEHFLSQLGLGGPGTPGSLSPSQQGTSTGNIGSGEGGGPGGDVEGQSQTGKEGEGELAAANIDYDIDNLAMSALGPAASIGYGLAQKAGFGVGRSFGKPDTGNLSLFGVDFGPGIVDVNNLDTVGFNFDAPDATPDDFGWNNWDWNEFFNDPFGEPGADDFGAPGGPGTGPGGTPGGPNDPGSEDDDGMGGGGPGSGPGGTGGGPNDPGSEDDDGMGDGGQSQDDAESGDAFAHGGLVTADHLTGRDPAGPDEGSIKVESGEFVVNKTAAEHYGTDFFRRLNERNIPKRQLRGLYGEKKDAA